MVTQGDRQNFQWRPNDNSSTTLARYDQEAQLWMRAFRNAERKNQSASIGETFTFLGLIIKLIAYTIILLVTLAIDLVKLIKFLFFSRQAI